MSIKLRHILEENEAERINSCSALIILHIL